MDLNRRGFFPLCGGGVFGVIPGFLKGEHLRPVTLVERGHVKRIRGICYFYNMLYNLYNLFIIGINNYIFRTIFYYITNNIKGLINIFIINILNNLK